MGSAVRWVHVPKSGQSFVLTLVRYACNQTAVPAESVHRFLVEHMNSSHKVLAAAHHFQLMSHDNCPRLVRPVRITHEPVAPIEARRRVCSRERTKPVHLATRRICADESGPCSPGARPFHSPLLQRLRASLCPKYAQALARKKSVP